MGSDIDVLHLPKADSSRLLTFLPLFAFAIHSPANDRSNLLLGPRDTFHESSPGEREPVEAGTLFGSVATSEDEDPKSPRPSSFLLGSTADTMRYHYPTAMRRSAPKRLASGSFPGAYLAGTRWGVGEVSSDWTAGLGPGLAVNGLSSKDVASYLWARGTEDVRLVQRS